MMQYPLQYRFYSISSSSLENPKTISITVDVIRYKTKKGIFNNNCLNFIFLIGIEHFGTSSYYLSTLKPGDTVPLFIRPSKFKLPENPQIPIIMVGAGTGLAPFMGFIRERYYQISKLSIIF